MPVCSKINTTEALLAQKYISHWDLSRKVSGWGKSVEQKVISSDIVVESDNLVVSQHQHKLLDSSSVDGVTIPLSSFADRGLNI